MAPKGELRARVTAAVNALPAELRAGYSEKAAAILRQQPVWQTAKTILFFAPLPGELDIWPLMSEAMGFGKTAALPRFDSTTGGYMACEVKDRERGICRGRFGVREPKAECRAVLLNRLDLVLVPGIAFDLQGRRLGRGKGYYDRLLAATSGVTCGVAFDEQIVEAIPVEPHDRDVDCILTPTRWLEL